MTNFDENLSCVDFFPSQIDAVPDPISSQKTAIWIPVICSYCPEC